MWDLGTYTLSSMRWQNSTYVGSGGGPLITGLAGSGNVNVGGQARLADVSWIGAAPLIDVDPQDVRWSLTGCSGVVNSHSLHHTRMSGNVTGTTFGVLGVYVPVAGVSSSDTSPRFDDNVGLSHTIRTLGEIVSPARIGVSFRLRKSGTAQSYTVGMFKNGAILPGGGEETFVVSNSPDVTYSYDTEDPARSTGDVYDVRLRPNGHTDTCVMVSLRLSFLSS